jgi:hypothetical protein
VRVATVPASHSSCSMGLPLIGRRLSSDPAVQLQVQIDASGRLYESVVEAAPEGEYREVPAASHSTIPMLAPDAVAAAVKDVLERL